MRQRSPNGALRRRPVRALAAHRGRDPRLRPPDLRRDPRPRPPPTGSAPAASQVPVRPREDALVIDGTHRQDGSRSEQPGWLVLPEKGLYAGILITDATGSAETSAAQYPFTAQRIHLHAGDPARKMGPDHRREGQLRGLRPRPVRVRRPPGRLLRGQPHERCPVGRHRLPRPQRRRSRGPHRGRDRERPGDLPGRPVLAPGGEGHGLPGDPGSPPRGRPGAYNDLQ
jgi:hypothetical protein